MSNRAKVTETYNKTLTKLIQRCVTKYDGKCLGDYQHGTLRVDSLDSVLSTTRRLIRIRHSTICAHVYIVQDFPQNYAIVFGVWRMVYNNL